MNRQAFARISKAARSLIVTSVSLIFPLVLACTSGESHFGSTSAFLSFCTESSCGVGAECSCDICNYTCESRQTCADRILGQGSSLEDLPDNVRCVKPSCSGANSQADSVCEISCTTDAECAFLDSAKPDAEHYCDEGQCRALQMQTQQKSASAFSCADQSQPLYLKSVSLSDSDSEFEERPLCLSAHEVSVAEYRACVMAGTCDSPSAGQFLTAERENFGIDWVTPKLAASYCDWIGGQLPSLELYLLASGFESPSVVETFPWGDKTPMPFDVPQALCGFEAKQACPVGSYPAGSGQWGHQDLVGNLAELIADGDEYCVIGADFSDESYVDYAECKPMNTASSNVTSDKVGFRCALPAKLDN